jgi:hypothetical protein
MFKNKGKRERERKRAKNAAHPTQPRKQNKFKNNTEMRD